jgi:ferredoxin
MSYTITENCTGCTACVRRCPVEAITGERKQRHAIDPDLCIECGACALVCPSRAILSPDGEPNTPQRPMEWPQPTWDYSACVLCRICVVTCPTGAIRQMDVTHANGIRAGEPYLHDPKACIACSFCAADCPTEAITMIRRTIQAD